MAVVAISLFAAKFAMADTTETPSTVSHTAPAPTGLPSHIWMDMAAAFAFGLVVILLVVIGYKSVDWALRRVDFDAELSKGNVAVGIVVASIVIGISLAVSNVVVAIIH